VQTAEGMGRGGKKREKNGRGGEEKEGQHFAPCENSCGRL